jgi:hypothetical protein
MDVPAQTPTRRLAYRPILVTLAATLVLGGGSIYGCFHGSSQDSATVFFAMFVLCAAAFAGALLWLVVALIVNAVRRGRG